MKGLSILVSAALFVVVLSVTASPAGEMQMDFIFQEPEVTLLDNYTVVNIEGCMPGGRTGEPALPVRPVTLLLPPGEDIVDFYVETGDLRKLDGKYLVRPVEPQVPLCFRDEYPAGPLEGKAEIYESDSPFPSNRATIVTIETFRGYRIAYINLHPVVYIPSEQLVEFYDSMTLHVTTAPDEQVYSNTAKMLRRDTRTVSRVRSMVDNPEETDAYENVSIHRPDPVVNFGIDEETYPYLLITDDAFVSAFREFADFKTRRGLRTLIVSIQDITANYPGRDTQEKIRNMIIDAYTNLGTEYVLLAGDDEYLPHRGLYVGGYYGDRDIAADMYYSCLDGDWNTDGDAYWGEPDEADLIAEISVGRAAVDNLSEVQNFTRKNYLYQTAPVMDDVMKGLMVGEDLGWSVWGGEYKDEIRLGSGNWGYTTTGFPSWFDVETLYDMNGTWSKNQLISKLNAGTHLLNHLGHSDVGYVMKMYSSDVDNSITNDGITSGLFIGYSQGCYPHSFDNRNPYGGYESDCIVEHFVLNPTGAVAFIGNSRYGWGNLYSTDGSSQHFDRQFFDAIFGEGITRIGTANEDSKADNIWQINEDENRWCCYELNLGGDPSLDIWAAPPVEPEVIHPAVVPIGPSPLQVSVARNGNPVEGALVCAMQTDGTYASDYTDQGGQVTLMIEPLTPDTLFISVSGKSLLPYSGYAIPISEGPYVAYYSHTIDDDNIGTSEGNGDGTPNPGEKLEIPVVLKNWGMDDATNVTAVLSTDDEYATITDAQEFYGTIAAGDEGTSDDDFDVEIGQGCPDGHVIRFTLSVTGSGDTWESAFTIIIGAPVVDFSDYTVDDSGYGDGDGIVCPGEGGEMIVTLANVGGGDISGVSAVLTSLDPDFQVISNSAYFGDIPKGGSATGQSAYIIAAGSGIGFGTDVPLRLSITGDGGYYTDNVDFEFKIGGFVDDFENGGDNWTHTNTGGADMWHLETYRNHTPGGGQSYKCGGDEWRHYEADTNCALDTKEILLPLGSKLEFWYWMRAQDKDETHAYDGGYVAISVDGGDWVEIEPEGGYPYKIATRLFYDPPFPKDTPVYSGAVLEFEKQVFDLSAYGGHSVKIRFRFGSDSSILGNFEGWYIDDVQIVTEGGGLIRLELAPVSTSVSEGDNLELDATVYNDGTSSRNLKFYTGIFLPNGDPYSGNPVYGPVSGNLPGGFDYTMSISHLIPIGSPHVTLTYKGTVEDAGTGSVLAEDSFEFDITN